MIEYDNQGRMKYNPESILTKDKNGAKKIQIT